MGSLFQTILPINIKLYLYSFSLISHLKLHQCHVISGETEALKHKYALEFIHWILLLLSFGIKMEDIFLCQDSDD